MWWTIQHVVMAFFAIVTVHVLFPSRRVKSTAIAVAIAYGTSLAVSLILGAAWLGSLYLVQAYSMTTAFYVVLAVQINLWRGGRPWDQARLRAISASWLVTIFFLKLFTHVVVRFPNPRLAAEWAEVNAPWVWLDAPAVLIGCGLLLLCVLVWQFRRKTPLAGDVAQVLAVSGLGLAVLEGLFPLVGLVRVSVEVVVAFYLGL